MAKFGTARDLLKLVLRKEPEAGQEVDRGPGVYICDECIDLCNEIIEEELSQNTEVRFDDLPKPRDLRLPERLHHRQEQAKKILSVAV